MTDTATLTVTNVAELCSYVKDRISAALSACGHPVSTEFVAAGLIAWDDCCGMLAVAPERVYQTAIWPAEGPDPLGCFDGTVGVQLVVLVVRCIPVLNDKGEPPAPAEMEAGYAELLNDAAVVWRTLDGADWPEGWQWTGLNQVFTGAEGGCIGVETRIAIGLDQETFCPCPPEEDDL